MKVVPFNSGETRTAVTVMRNGELFGSEGTELQDGNMIPRLCVAVGDLACKVECQLSGEQREAAGVLCAENNISSALEQFGVISENFVLAAATREKREDGTDFDNVFFGDALELTKARKSPEGYTQIPDANAFFFRPGIDKTSQGDLIEGLGMRMADCGSVNYEMRDHSGDLVLGQAHFSRINMFGPSGFDHELNDNRVSWGEYVLGSAIEHYGADPSSIRIKLVAAVEGKDFLHHYDSRERMEGHFKGWAELGFMHPEVDKSEDFDCLIDYREMIEWQLKQGAEHYGISVDQIEVDAAINTGNIALGHASHHWASDPKNKIAHGRDLYMIKQNVSSKSDQKVTDFERAATMLLMEQVIGLPIESGMPKLDDDPFVALYELRMGHVAPPRELWDTKDNRESASKDGFHPMTYWLISSTSSEDMHNPVYKKWLDEIE